MKAVEAIGARVRPSGLEQQKEAQHNATSADVRHDEVEHARFVRFFLLVLEANKAVSRQGHDLPGDQEEKRIVRDENEIRREKQGAEKRPQDAHVLAPKKAAGAAQ